MDDVKASPNCVWYWGGREWEGGKARGLRKFKGFLHPGWPRLSHYSNYLFEGPDSCLAILEINF